MHNTHRIAAAALSLAWAFPTCSQMAEGPPVPYEDVGACPFEGCVYREWRANAEVAIHTERRSNSSVVFHVAKGEKVQALTGVVVIVKAGRIQFGKTQRLDTSSGPIDILPGQTLFMLAYEGEGFTKAWFNGRPYKGVDVSGVRWASGMCGFSDPERCPGREVMKSETQWWVQVRNASGLTGWTLETAKFDNKDRFGKTRE